MRGLTWEDERYVRTYTRDTPDWMLLSWRAQGLYHSIRRKADRAGIIQLGRIGRRGVAPLVNGAFEADDVLEALDELERDGWVEIVGERMIIPEFIESEEALASPLARQRAHRERARDLARSATAPAPESSRPVTAPPEQPRDQTSRPVTPTRKRSRPDPSGHGAIQNVTPSDPFRAVPEDLTRSAAAALDHSKPGARGTPRKDPHPPAIAPTTPMPASPEKLAMFAHYGIAHDLPGETPEQSATRRKAQLVAVLDAEMAKIPLATTPDPGSSGGEGGDEQDGDDDPDPPSQRRADDPPAALTASAATPEPTAAPGLAPLPAGALAPVLAPGMPLPPFVAVAGETWPPPDGWIAPPGTPFRSTCGYCDAGRRYPEHLLCTCQLGVFEGARRAKVAAMEAEEARDRARAEARQKRRVGAPLFGAETPDEAAALAAPSTTPLGKLGLAALLPPPGYGAIIPDDPAALILATLARQPEPIRHLADEGIAGRLAGLVMGTKATVAQIEDAIRTGSAKLPANLGNVRADDPQGLDRVQRWIAGCLKGCRNQGPGRAAPHDPSEALTVVTRRILARFTTAYAEQEGIDYLAGEDDPAHAEVIAAHVKRQVEAAAAKAGTAPDAGLGGAILDQLFETWFGSRHGEQTGYALAQLAGALRREPARWAFRPPPPDPYEGQRFGPAPPVLPRKEIVPVYVCKPQNGGGPVIDIFTKKKQVSG